MSERRTTVLKDSHAFALPSSLHLGDYPYWISIAVLAMADVLAFSLAMLLFRIGRNVPQLVFFPRGFEHQTPIDIFIVLGCLFILARYLAGDYYKRQLFWDEARSTTVALIVTAIPDVLILVIFKNQYSTFTELGSWVFLLAAVPLMRYAVRFWLAYFGAWRVPTALIATGPRADAIYTALSKTLSLGFDIRWLVLEGYDRELPNKQTNLKYLFLSDADDIAEKMVASGCSHVVIATDDMQSSAFANLIQRLMERNITVAFIPSFLRLPLVRTTTSYFFGHDILLFQVRNSLWRTPHRFVKRTFDIVCSLGMLLLFTPVFVAIALAIKKHDGGKVTYAQKRVGRYGRPFYCLKFRTMAEDADDRRAQWERESPELYAEFLKTYKLRDDPRVTKPGKWLRKTSLDELPQLLNVLRGEMSLVGPRPIPEQQLVDQYGQAAQLYMQVRPGLTGLWQISGRNETTLDQRVVYDEWYILNWSFWYDIVILIQTAWIVISGRGAF